MGGLIGTNIYANDARALSTAGPAGALTAIVIVGFIVTMVMECVGEMTQLFPVSTIFNSVQEFVDRDIALIVGIAYWQEPLPSPWPHTNLTDRYTYSIALASLVLSASKLSTYWELSKTGRISIFGFAMPILVVALNLLPITVGLPLTTTVSITNDLKFRRYIFTFGTLFKFCVLAGVMICMIIAASMPCRLANNFCRTSDTSREVGSTNCKSYLV
jgi:hypothetical protein